MELVKNLDELARRAAEANRVLKTARLEDISCRDICMMVRRLPGLRDADFWDGFGGIDIEKVEKAVDEYKKLEAGNSDEGAKVKRVSAAERYRSMVSSGRCSSCGRPAIDGQTKCQVCKDKERRNYLRLRSEGRCCVCKRRAQHGMSKCRACQDKYNTKYYTPVARRKS